LKNTAVLIHEYKGSEQGVKNFVTI